MSSSVATAKEKGFDLQQKQAARRTSRPVSGEMNDKNKVYKFWP